MTQSWEYQEFNELNIKKHKVNNYIIKNIMRTFYTWIVDRWNVAFNTSEFVHLEAWDRYN